jgi:hypothetical protein
MSSPNSSVGVSCHLLAEFTDDATDCVPSEPLDVPDEILALSVVRTLRLLTAMVPGNPAAASKEFWLPTIQHSTEPVPGKEGRLRCLGSQHPNRSEITVEYSSGSAPEKQKIQVAELEVADSFCLKLVRPENRIIEDAGQQREYTGETTILIPWTAIVAIHFSCYRPAESEPKS